MELGTVSFIFCIIEDRVDIERQNELIIEEEYYFFNFVDNNELRVKVKEKIKLLNNNEVTLYQNKWVKRRFIGTRKFCSTFTFSEEDNNLQNGSELGYSLFYTDSIGKVEQLAYDRDVDLDYYDYGNDYFIS